MNANVALHSCVTLELAFTGPFDSRTPMLLDPMEFVRLLSREESDAAQWLSADA
jgi:hypothetical protein